MSTDLRYTVDADDGPLKQALRRVQDQFKETHAGANNMVAGLQGSFGTLNKIIAGVTAALAGGVAIKASVDATKDFTTEANKLGRVLGISATEASTLNVALGDVYADTDMFTGAAAKLAKELRTNEAALQAMGLKTRDANGALRPLKDLMLDSIAVVNSYKQGIDRNIAAQTMWGKGADEMAPILKLTNQLLEESKKKQEELGLVVGSQNVDATERYKAAMNDVGDVMLAVKKAIGDAVMPVLTQLATWFTDIGPAAVKIIKVAVGGLISTFWLLRSGVVVVFETINAAVISVTEPLRAVASAFRHILTGDFEAAANEFRNIPNVVQGAWNKALISIGETADDTRSKVEALFSAPTASKAPSGKGKGAGGLVKSDTNVVQAWDAELNIIKQKQAEENALNDTFYEVSKQYEKAFWEAKRDLTARGSKERLAVEAKVTAATLEVQKEAFELRIAQLKREEAMAEQDFKRREALAQKEVDLVASRFGAESKQAEDAQRRMEDVQRQARDQRRQLREIELAEIRANGLQTVELEQQRQQFLFEAGQITREELLASEQAFEQRRFEIQSEALVQRQQMIDPNLNPVEYARIKGEILQLERDHQTRVQELKNQAELLATTNSRGIWNSVTTNMEQSLSKMIQGMSSFSGFVKAIWNSLRASVADVLAKMAMDYIKNTALMASIKKALAIFDIGTDAARAGAGAAASAASTPVIGWLTAPTAAASVFAMASAFAGQVPSFSAAQGWDIPAGINPIVQTHAREMILPAEQADVIRDMAGTGGGTVHQHVHVYAMDQRTFTQWAKDNPEGFAAGMQAAHRRGFT